MPVEVIHADNLGDKTVSVFESDSWSVDPETNTLTVGDYGASFAVGYWCSIRRVPSFLKLAKE